jgi:hypothetical protein
MNDDFGTGMEKAIEIQRQFNEYHALVCDQIALQSGILPQEYRDKIHQLADEIEWPEFTDDLDFFDAHTEIT